MKKQINPIFSSWFLLFLLLFLHSTSLTAQEVEDEREFDYADGGKKGPRRWGELRKDWAACKNGERQSPIDLSNKRVRVIPKLGKLKRSYKPGNATVRNRGHDISIYWELGSAGSIQINGTNYMLLTSHWHSPSEHTVDGRRYDLELHMVHLNPDLNVKNKIAVVGLLYKIGKPDVFLSKLSRSILSIADGKEEKKMGVMDPRQIKMGGRKYYRYMGSLTVPPCTEGVIWTINKRVRTVSREQVDLLREAVHDYAEMNARPVQPLNRREIDLYGPRFRPGDTSD